MIRPPPRATLFPHTWLFRSACVVPPVVQFTSVGRKDTLDNVEATGEFTVSLTPEWLFEQVNATGTDFPHGVSEAEDRKSTRLNSSHANISYAVFCLKKKKVK